MGSEVSGQQAGMTLRAAKADLEGHGFEWSKEAPEYAPPPEVKTRPGAVKEAAIDIIEKAGHEQEQAPQAPQASTAPTKPKPATTPPPMAHPPGRPARAGGNPKPAAPAKTKPTIKKAPKMNVHDVMRGLSQLLPETPPPAPRPASRPINEAPMLNDAQRHYLRARYPDQRRVKEMEERVQREQHRLHLHNLKEPPQKTRWLHSTKPHDAWETERQNIAKKLTDQQRRTEAWFDQNVYTRPDLLEDLRTAVAKEDERRSQVAVTEYQRQERIAAGQGPQRYQAQREMKDLEERHPGPIGEYKAQRAAKEAEEAETSRKTKEAEAASIKKAEIEGGGHAPASEGSKYHQVRPKG